MAGGGGLIQIPALFAVDLDRAADAPRREQVRRHIRHGERGTLRYARTVTIPWRALAPLALFVLAASLAGAKLATIVSPELFRPLAPLMLLVAPESLATLVSRGAWLAVHAVRG